jgi:hypothetical protein
VYEPIGTNDLEEDLSETVIPIYKLHGVTFQKMATSVLTDMKTSNLAKNVLVHELCQKFNSESGNEKTWLFEYSMTTQPPPPHFQVS